MKMKHNDIRLIDFGVAVSPQSDEEKMFQLGTIADLTWFTKSFAEAVLFPRGSIRTKAEEDSLNDAQKLFPKRKFNLND